MFFAVLYNNDKESLSKRIRSYFKSPQMSINKFEVPFSLPFYVLQVKAYHGVFPWQAVCDRLGGYKNKVLFSNDIELDKKYGLSQYAPCEFLKLLLFNASLGQIKRMKFNPKALNISVVDETGTFLKRIEFLVPLCSQIYILTSYISEYEKLALYLLNKFGISIIISHEATNQFFESDIIISHSSRYIPASFSGIVFTNEKDCQNNSTVFCPDGFSLPDDYIELLPDGIDELLFAGALFELCGAVRLGDLTYDKMTIQYNDVQQIKTEEL